MLINVSNFMMLNDEEENEDEMRSLMMIMLVMMMMMQMRKKKKVYTNTLAVGFYLRVSDHHCSYVSAGLGVDRMWATSESNVNL